MRKDVRKKKKRTREVSGQSNRAEGMLNSVPLCSDSTDVMMPIAAAKVY